MEKKKEKKILAYPIAMLLTSDYLQIPQLLDNVEKREPIKELVAFSSSVLITIRTF